MRTRSLFGFDILLLTSVFALMIIGVLFIYSSGISSAGDQLSNEYIKQIIWIGIGIIILVVVIFTDYARTRLISFSINLQL